MSHFFFDDTGKQLNIGDVVLVNDEYSSVIDENPDGDRYVKGLPTDLIVQSVVLVGSDD